MITTTVGELRKALRSCEAEESVHFLLTKKNGAKENLSFACFSSTAGGRAVVMHFDPLETDDGKDSKK